MTASAMSLFGLIAIWIGTFFLDIIGLTNILGFAMRPNNGHACFWFANMTNFVREIRIRLNFKNKKCGVGDVMVEFVISIIDSKICESNGQRWCLHERNYPRKQWTDFKVTGGRSQRAYAHDG